VITLVSLFTEVVAEMLNRTVQIEITKDSSGNVDAGVNT